MVKTYNKAWDGDKLLSPSFRVREFACKDGSDTVYIDEALVAYLQRIRNWAGAEVRITSGYRTAVWNRKIGGAPNSYHTKGQAVDIVVMNKSIYQVARFAEALGIKGIERNEDSNYVHIDTRKNKYFWRRYNRKNYIVSTFGGHCEYSEPKKLLKRGNISDGVKWVQFWLWLWDYDIAVDGIFGKNTEKAVKDLQKRCKLTVDGVIGEKTRAALKGF